MNSPWTWTNATEWHLIYMGMDWYILFTLYVQVLLCVCIRFCIWYVYHVHTQTHAHMGSGMCVCSEDIVAKHYLFALWKWCRAASFPWIIVVAGHSSCKIAALWLHAIQQMVPSLGPWAVCENEEKHRWRQMKADEGRTVCIWTWGYSLKLPNLLAVWIGSYIS